MSATRPPSPASTVILSLTLITIVVLFGNVASWPEPLHDGLVALLLLVGGAATWRAGARCVRSAAPTIRLLAAAAALLVAPFLLLSLLVGVGPPHLQPPRENDLRFLVLAVDAILVGIGLCVLKEALATAGERLYGTLGSAAGLLACPFYVAFSLIQRNDYVAEELGWSWVASVSGHLHELTPLDALSMSLLFFAGALTYLATAAFARGLRLTGWLGARAAGLCIGISSLGMAFLMARGFAYPSLQAAFAHWYTVPGFVAGIPAVPWMAPCAMGVLLLRRCVLDDARPTPAAGPIRAPAPVAAPAAAPATLLTRATTGTS